MGPADLRRWRLLVTEPADGATNMAVDEALWRGRLAGTSPPTVRFFAWRPPTVSLGYGQPLDRHVDVGACTKGQHERGRGTDGCRAPIRAFLPIRLTQHRAICCGGARGNPVASARLPEDPRRGAVRVPDEAHEIEGPDDATVGGDHPVFEIVIGGARPRRAALDRGALPSRPRRERRANPRRSC
ncbi:MAG: hypothetical protein FJZ38_16275 [Candidatus Rokubacteria bacterium]|nr:hypothetical protein [Candidatus Rokubacteria bacterium]